MLKIPRFISDSILNPFSKIRTIVTTQFSMCKFIFNECLIKCQYFRHQILNQEFCFFFMVGFSYDAQHWLQLYIKS